MADGKELRRARESAAVVLGEDPLGGASEAVKSGVQGEVSPGITRVTGVVRREDGADEADDRQAVMSAVTEAVEVPPGVAPGREDEVTPRSSQMIFSAMRADSATIGTPAPGCALPPTA